MNEIPTYEESNSLAGKVVIVTGSSGGIGAQIARRFAEAGCSVLLNADKNRAGMDETLKHIVDSGGRAAALLADVGEPNGAEALVAEAVGRFGRVDVLVNNAGIQPLRALLEMDAVEWDKVLTTNLRGTFLCTQGASRQMIAQGGGGSIINISSIEAQTPVPNHSHYGASKAAIDNFTKAAAIELGPHGIRVNAVLPGLIDTGGLEQAWPEGVERWLKSAPLKRLGHGMDVADACLFLASPAARWITGTLLPVDGGILAQQTY
ncbi:MAG: SDR family NAD(P)-dependent oxidoreductase [Anaerolineales bacterium]